MYGRETTEPRAVFGKGGPEQQEPKPSPPMACQLRGVGNGLLRRDGVGEAERGPGTPAGWGEQRSHSVAPGTRTSSTCTNRPPSPATQLGPRQALASEEGWLILAKTHSGQVGSVPSPWTDVLIAGRVRAEKTMRLMDSGCLRGRAWHSLATCLFSRRRGRARLALALGALSWPFPRKGSFLHSEGRVLFQALLVETRPLVGRFVTVLWSDSGEATSGVSESGAQPSPGHQGSPLTQDPSHHDLGWTLDNMPSGTLGIAGK